MDVFRIARRRDQLNRVVLGAIGLLVLALTLWGQGPSVYRASAQAQSPFATLTPTATFDPFATPTFTPTWTPTPGPTPTKVRRLAVEITEPKETDAIFGNTRIIGTSAVESFLRYELHLSQAGLENWQWLSTQYAPVYDDVLYTLNTLALPDGFYDLRLRTLANDGSYGEAFVRGVEVRNTNPPTLTPGPEVTPTPVSPLPTPTPAVVSRVPGGQGLYAPDNGSVVRGVVDIVATVNGTREQKFARWELAISPAGAEVWTWLAGTTEQTWQDTIYVWDTTAYPDGLYDLRLRIVYEDSNYSEFYLRNLSVANTGAPQVALAPVAGFTAPRSGNTVSGVVDFMGATPLDDFLRWELYWSPGGREEWSFLVSSVEPVDNGLLARLDLGLLPPGRYDFRLRVVRSDYNYTDYTLRDVVVAAP